MLKEIKSPFFRDPVFDGADFGNGLHADVLVHGEEAYIIYFTHPGRREGETRVYELQRSTIQMRRLGFDGVNITCDRDEKFAYDWSAPEI